MSGVGLWAVITLQTLWCNVGVKSRECIIIKTFKLYNTFERIGKYYSVLNSDWGKTLLLWLNVGFMLTVRFVVRWSE